MSGFVRVAGLALALWCSAITSGTADALESGLGPITIDECRINNTRSYVSAFRPIVIAFTNRRAVPAEEIRFTVQYAGRTERIIDRGTFSQNIRVEHAFGGFYNVRYGGPGPSCAVDYVEFRDGTVWLPTSPASAPKCNSTPPILKIERG